MKFLKYSFLLLGLLGFTTDLDAQALPMNRYAVGKTYVLDNIASLYNLTPSFAYSSRKLKKSYTGFAIKLRRSTDNAEANVAFDVTDVVTDNSTVTITVAGTSGLAVGATLTLASFRSGATLYVKTWYNQATPGGATNQGNQNTVSYQPTYVMGSAGTTNQYPSLLFDGTKKQHVVPSNGLNVLLGPALIASISMVAKIGTSTTNNNSFGYMDASNNTLRWSAHMNWPDNYMYTDFGKDSDVSRQFLNTSSVGVYKQFTMIRYTANKTVRISGEFKLNNVTQQTNVVGTNTISTTNYNATATFGIGATLGNLFSTQNGYTGYIPEFILFPSALDPLAYIMLENSQISFWGAY